MFTLKWDCQAGNKSQQHVLELQFYGDLFVFNELGVESFIESLDQYTFKRARWSCPVLDYLNLLRGRALSKDIENLFFFSFLNVSK